MKLRNDLMYKRQMDLVKSSRKVFPNDSVKECVDEKERQSINEICNSWGILIQRVDKHRKTKVYLEPTEEILTDEDSDFERTCKHALKKAISILDQPYFDDKFFQGKIVIGNQGIKFVERK